MGMTIMIAGLVWVLGGGLYIKMATAAAPNSDAAACLAGLRHADPAAMVAVALFVIVWPAIFVGTTVRSWRKN